MEANGTMINPKLRETKEAEGTDAASVVVPMDPRIGVDS
jgi:hypothetical protein